MLAGVVDRVFGESLRRCWRTTRTERSASWKTSAGAFDSSDALLEHLGAA